MLSAWLGNGDVRRKRGLSDEIQRKGAGVREIPRLFGALTNQRQPGWTLLFQYSAATVEPGNYGDPFELLAHAHGRLAALADPNIFPCFDDDGRYLLRQGCGIERPKAVFLLRFKLLCGDVRL